MPKGMPYGKGYPKKTAHNSGLPDPVKGSGKKTEGGMLKPRPKYGKGVKGKYKGG